MDVLESNTRRNELDKTGRLEEKLDKALQDKSQNIQHFGHPDRSMSLSNLTYALSTGYKQLGEIEDLERAITVYEQELSLCPPGHSDRSRSLKNLAYTLSTRYKQLGEIGDLERAITFYEQDLSLCPPGHPDRSISLENLAYALFTRYKQLRETGDLERVVTSHEQALSLRPPGHSDRSMSLNNLAYALSIRYEDLGEIEDLETAITFYEQALSLCPLGHPCSFLYLNNLATALFTRYKQFGEMENLKRAITCNEQTLSLCSPDDHERLRALNSLADALSTRYKQLGEIEDLEKAITYNQQVLSLCPPGHPGRSTSLNNLAFALSTRYEQLGEREDLERAITYNEQALSFCPPGHLERSISLNNLANALSTRYVHHGDKRDLERAITYNKQALHLRPPGHPDRPVSLNNLANTLSIRHKHLGEIGDLVQAISYTEQALSLCPPGHPGRSTSLNNLANFLSTRYKQFGDIEDLERAITHHEQALSFRPPGHLERSISLNNLAYALSTRYEDLGKIADLERAITFYEHALSLYPPGHPDMPMSLNNLANALSTRYMQQGHKADLDKATSNYKSALSCLQTHHPFYSSVLFAQASLLLTAHNTHWVPCHGCSHIDDACTLLNLAACHATSSLVDRFKAAKKWAGTAHWNKHNSAITAYSLALDLQQQHLSLLPSMPSQLERIEKSASLSLNAASCAISIGNLEMAVQLLEQGRSILWSKIQGYRQSFEMISHKNADLANELKAVAQRLENNAVSSGVDVTHQRALAEMWTTLLGEIRKLDDFSEFLQATPFKILQKAAEEGPVIMINISDFQSDAIILTSNASPVVVALYDASSERLKQLLQQLIDIQNGHIHKSKTVSLLQNLWYAVVQPVVNQLAQLRVPQKSRIWWCPTSYLCALPIHAAGPYQRGANNLPHLYTSSYTPTLVSLIRARSGLAPSQNSPNMLLVSQADETIPQVAAEVEVVKKLRKDLSSYSGQAAHKQAVLAGLQSHPWVHLACHGHLDFSQPFNSWFQLYSGEHLSILDLVKAQLPNAEFAFLSACHSATGDIFRTPDESIHFAAVLQCSGFRSVIGTLWEMADIDGPPLAHAFYSHMFHNGPENVNVRNAAEALNLATKELKKQHVTLDRWINFIHIGA